MKRKPKCYATPRWAKSCDGCNAISTKCPYRYKERDLRAKSKCIAEKEIVRELSKHD